MHKCASIISIAVLPMLGGCDTPMEPLPTDTPRTEARAFVWEGIPMEIETTLSRLFIRPGDTVDVSVTLRNLGEESYTFTFNNGCIFSWGVDDAAGDLIYPTSWFCGHVMMEVEVQPGEEISNTVQWDGHVREEGEIVPISSGIYNVWGGFYWKGPTVPLEVRR